MTRLLIRSCILVLLANCGGTTPSSEPDQGPRVVVWAWERNEDLSFLDPQRHSVAFLAQTILLRNDEVEVVPRRQPLSVVPGTYLIAVIRIETSRNETARAILSPNQRKIILENLNKSIELPNVRAVQIDFDALVSERAFYKQLIIDARNGLRTDIALSITALASWCSDDRWLNEMPIDEAVPMLFDIGPDAAEIKRRLANDLDWKEPKCRSSYGLSVDEPPINGLRKGRRNYLFKSAAWTPNDLKTINTYYEE